MTSAGQTGAGVTTGEAGYTLDGHTIAASHRRTLSFGNTEVFEHRVPEDIGDKSVDMALRSARHKPRKSRPALKDESLEDDTSSH